MSRLKGRDPKHFTYTVAKDGYAASAMKKNSGATKGAAQTTTGTAFSRLGVKSGRNYEGVLYTLPVYAHWGTGTAGATRTVTAAVTLKSSTASGGTFTSFATGQATISPTSASGANRTNVTLGANLLGQGEWVRATVSMTFATSSTGGTSGAKHVASTVGPGVWTFVGPDQTPASG